MKTTLFAALLSTALASQSLHAQTPPPPPAPGHGPAAGPGARKEEKLREVATVQGKVAMMTTNDDFVYDGFVVLSGSDSIRVKFPAHMGRQVMSAVKAGSTVSVSGDLRTHPEGKKNLRLMSLTAGGQTLTDTPPAKPSTPSAEAAASGSGKITALQYGRMGEMKGFIIDGNTILKLPPHIGSQFNALVKTGDTIGYTGGRKAAVEGEVSAGNYSVVHAQTVTVNGKQYLTN